MTGIQFVTDEKGHKVGVLIDQKNTDPSGKIFGTVSSRNRAARKKAFPTKNTVRRA